MKRIVLMLLVGLCVQHIHAQDWAKARLEKSPRHHERVVVKQGDRAIATLVVYPETKDKKPVVVLIHDSTGLTDWFQSFADEVAGMGYVVLAPDLSSGDGLPADQQVTADLNAVADYGLKLPASRWNPVRRRNRLGRSTKLPFRGGPSRRGRGPGLLRRIA